MNAGDVLAAHLFTLYPGEIACDCEWTKQDDDTRQGERRMIAAHVAHVAAVLEAGPIAEAERRGVDIGRRATLDPGAFVKRGPDYEGNEYGERIDQWQARAIEAGLAAARAAAEGAS